MFCCLSYTLPSNSMDFHFLTWTQLHCNGMLWRFVYVIWSVAEMLTAHNMVFFTCNFLHLLLLFLLLIKFMSCCWICVVRRIYLLLWMCSKIMQAKMTVWRVMVSTTWRSWNSLDNGLKHFINSNRSGFLYFIYLTNNVGNLLIKNILYNSIK